mgnify:CR=1 FL=1
MIFPDKLYVGVRDYLDTSGNGGGKFPQGFPTPHGTDAAFTKRKATVDKWTGSKGTFNVIDNVPVSGFRIVGDVARHGGWFGNSNIVWRVEDPRGFEIDVFSPNLAAMISQCTLEQGVITTPCLYARNSSGRNALVPITTDEYKAALSHTKRKKASSTSLKDIKMGDVVQCSDGSEVIFVKKIYCIAVKRQTATTAPYDVFNKRTYSLVDIERVVVIVTSTVNDSGVVRNMNYTDIRSSLSHNGVIAPASQKTTAAALAAVTLTCEEVTRRCHNMFVVHVSDAPTKQLTREFVLNSVTPSFTAVGQRTVNRALYESQINSSVAGVLTTEHGGRTYVQFAGPQYSQKDIVMYTYGGVYPRNRTTTSRWAFGHLIEQASTQVSFLDGGGNDGALHRLSYTNEDGSYKSGENRTRDDIALYHVLDPLHYLHPFTASDKRAPGIWGSGDSSEYDSHAATNLNMYEWKQLAVRIGDLPDVPACGQFFSS